MSSVQYDEICVEGRESAGTIGWRYEQRRKNAGRTTVPTLPPDFTRLGMATVCNISPCFAGAFVI